MIKQILLFFGFFFIMCHFVSAQSGAIEGRLIDELGEGVPFANVAIYKTDVLIRGVETDIDGNYVLTNIDPGSYDLEATFIGFQTQRQSGVLVSDGIVRTNFNMKEGVTLDLGIEIIDYIVPLIQTDETSSGGIKTGEEIKNLPIKNITAIAATTAGLSVQNGEINVKGSRDDGTVFLLDGIRVSGNLPPQTEIEQLQVITGGLSARYGDVTGGVISITSKGPSSKFSGALELETSEYLDDYGYNLINANVSGPILKKDGRSLLGFRLAGQYRRRDDDNPSAVGVYRLPDSEIAKLEANPDTIIGGTQVGRAEYLDPSLVQLMDARPNERDERYDITGKVDARLSDNIDITLTGTYNKDTDRFIPGQSSQRTAVPNRSTNNFFGGGHWALLNHTNNPTQESTRYRGNFRFRHRLGKSGFNEESENQNSIIENISYTIQAGVERFERSWDDQRHGRNLFDYGHIGAFTNAWTPSVAQIRDSTLFDIGNAVFNPITGDIEFWGHQGFTQGLTGYTEGTTNPSLSNENDFINEVPSTFDLYPWYNGLEESDITQLWFGIFNNAGTVFNSVRDDEFDRYTMNVNTGFDLYPGSSKNSRHSIEFGFNYEQRINRLWSFQPQELWDVMRLQANSLIDFIDPTSEVGTITTTIPVPGTGPMDFRTFLPGIVPNDAKGTFFQNIRTLTGQGPQERVDTDALDPSLLSLSLFTAAEINDRNLATYYGYDYQGNRISSNLSFNDFFRDTLANGNRLFPIGALKPIYWGAYVEDKFSLKDVIFKIGVRVERFDNNTSVLRDPMSLYPIQNASNFYSQTGLERPSGVGDDYLVYTTTTEGQDVVGYRQGEQWFNATGEAVNSPTEIFRGSIVRAKLVDPEANIQTPDFDPDGSFIDYEPEIKILPRFAVSFPISDEANFFAHYDILVQRPSFTETSATAYDYYYFQRESNENILGNPALTTQTTIDYEVGFKQKVSNTAAITISAYYKELRDLIQLRTIKNLPSSASFSVSEYTTYDNIDFGTTKGFTFQLDLRRTNNFQANLNYTLGFADGTGSDINSSFGLTQNQSIRTLSPLSFDERHSLNLIADYRYSSGNRYNGPRLFGTDLFANAGLNIQANVISGRPFTQSITPNSQPSSLGNGFAGTINGSRLPWIFSLDARLDKDFLLTKKDATNRLNLNLYFRVNNLLDRNNVIDVYDATGSPSDDGYLSFAEGRDRVRDFGDDERARQSYLNAYQWGTLRPGYYVGPRRLFVGAIFSF